MKIFSIFVASLFLFGCVPVKNEYYLPVSEEYSYEGTHCGFAPHGGYSNLVAPGARLAISGTTKDGSLWLNFQFIVDSNHKFSLRDNAVTISSRDENEIKEYLTESSGHEFPSINPTSVMDGDREHLYIANLKIISFSPEQFTLTLSDAEIDSNVVSIAPIEFRRVTKSGVLTCIQ